VAEVLEEEGWEEPQIWDWVEHPERHPGKLGPMQRKIHLLIRMFGKR
jgi:hypothetical protein